MTKKRFLTTLFSAFLGASTFAQTTIDKTLETFSMAIGTVGLGTSENDFFMMKTALKRPESSAIDFRDEVVETIDKDNIKTITYYFDKENEQPLYELIIEFSDEPTRIAMAEKLFGEPNYPDKPDHWIAGAQENIVTVAWVFGNKIVIAANLPGSEWTGDELFNIPPGFEMYKHLPHMSEWPEEEVVRFFTSLEAQIEAGASDFTAIRSADETDGYYTCTAPLAGAEGGNVFKNDDGKWVAASTMISGANAENSILWKLDAENLLGKAETGKIKLTRTKSRAAFGTTVDLWDVADKTGKLLDVQVGLLHYEWGAEGLWNIGLLVLQR